MPDHGIFEKVEIHGAVPGFIIRHTRPGSKIVKNHWHPELEINTVFEGSSRFFINGRVEDVTPQHIVLVNSREVHSSIPYFATDGFAITGINVALLVVLVAFPALLLFSESGPGSMRAPIWAALAAGLIVGAIAQRTRLCMVGGIRDVILF